MENSTNKPNIFYVENFLDKIMSTYKIFFTDINLIILAILPGIIMAIVMFILLILGIGGMITSNGLGAIDYKTISASFILLLILGFFIYIIIAIIVGMLSAVMITIYLRQKELGNIISIQETFNRGKEKISLYFKVMIDAFLYMIRPIIILVAGILSIPLIIFMGSNIIIISFLLIMWGIIDGVIRSLDIVLIYNIAIVENKDGKTAIQQSKTMMKGHKRYYIGIMIAFGLINSLIISILIGIFNITKDSNTYDVITTILNTLSGFMGTILIYMLYRQYSIQSNEKLPDTQETL